MIYKNLTTHELYSSISDFSIISEMMKNGIKIGSTQLAVSAMEELLKKGLEDTVIEILTKAYKDKELKVGSPMFSMVTTSLTEDRKKNVCAALFKEMSACAKDKPAEYIEPECCENEIKNLFLVGFPPSESAKKLLKEGKFREFLLGYRVDDDGNPVVDDKSEPEAKSQAPRLMAPWPPVEEDW